MRAAILAGLSLALPPAQQREAPRPLALRGLDPVELCRGRQTAGVEELALDQGVLRYRFESEATRAEFRSDPARYEIQFGGACANEGPLSEPADPGRFVVWGGHVYAFHSGACRQTFLDDPPSYLDAPDEVPDETPESAQRGAELVELAVKGIGGAERLDALERLVLLHGARTDAAGHELAAACAWSFAFPDRVRTDRTNAGARTSWVVTKEGGFVERAGRVDPLHASQRALVEREADRMLVTILKSRGRPDFRAVARGTAEVEGTPVERVAVAFAGLTSILSVDVATGRVLRQHHVARADGGPNGLVVLTYSDFREVGGLVLPFAQRAIWNGFPAPALSFAWDAVQVDPPLAPATFERPAPRAR